MRLFVVAAIFLASIVASDYVDEANDAIVIEASESSREGKNFNYDPLSLTYQFRQGHGGACVNSKGLFGRCAKLSSCYALYPIPLEFPDWVFGSKDLCESKGVCCANNNPFPGVVATNANPDDAKTYQNFLYPASTAPLTNQLNDPSLTFGAQGFPSLFQFPGAFPGAQSPVRQPTDQYPGGFPGQYPGLLPQYPGQNPQYPGQNPQYPGQNPQYPGQNPQYPGNYPPPSVQPEQPQVPVQQPITVQQPSFPGQQPVEDSEVVGAAHPSEPASQQGSTDYSSCGLTRYGNLKIAGGENAEPAQFPWGVALFNRGRQFCGGSIISRTHILTAAHCVDGMSSEDARSVRVRLGDHNIDVEGEHGLVTDEKGVKLIVKNKLFSMQTLHHDVAIIVLDSPIQYRDNIRPVCLASGGDYAGKEVIVSGWGLLSASGPRPTSLQNIKLTAWTQERCKKMYEQPGVSPAGITPGMLCAGSRGKDSCSGDSGGPMVFKNSDGRHEQVGIVSWGIGCGREDFPGVYTRVTEVRDWISKVMNTY